MTSRGWTGWAARLGTLSLLASPAWAGKADVLGARVECNPERICRFAVTVEHADAGWQHYADRYEVMTPDGKTIGTRVLEHPHSPEPFTRGLAGVQIPKGVDRVRIRAHDKVHGYGGAEVTVEIPE
jgi:hypothetical protein